MKGGLIYIRFSYIGKPKVLSLHSVIKNWGGVLRKAEKKGLMKSQ